MKKIIGVILLLVFFSSIVSFIAPIIGGILFGVINIFYGILGLIFNPVTFIILIISIILFCFK